MYADPSTFNSGQPFSGWAYWTDKSISVNPPRYIVQSQWPTVVYLVQKTLQAIFTAQQQNFFTVSDDGAHYVGAADPSMVPALVGQTQYKLSDMVTDGQWSDLTAHAVLFFLAKTGNSTAATMAGADFTTKQWTPEVLRYVLWIAYFVTVGDVNFNGSPVMSATAVQKGDGLALDQNTAMPTWNGNYPLNPADGYVFSKLGDPLPNPPSLVAQGMAATRPWPMPNSANAPAPAPAPIAPAAPAPASTQPGAPPPSGIVSVANNGVAAPPAKSGSFMKIAVLGAVVVAAMMMGDGGGGGGRRRKGPKGPGPERRGPQPFRPSGGGVRTVMVVRQVPPGPHGLPAGKPAFHPRPKMPASFIQGHTGETLLRGHTAASTYGKRVGQLGHKLNLHHLRREGYSPSEVRTALEANEAALHGHHAHVPFQLEAPRTSSKTSPSRKRAPGAGATTAEYRSMVRQSASKKTKPATKPATKRKAKH